MNKGWIKLHRKILSWEWYRDANVLRVYLHLLLQANYEDKSWNGLELGCGDCYFTFQGLASDLGLSVKQVRLALNKLELSQNIVLKKSGKRQVATLVKYDLFQSERFERGEIKSDKSPQKDNVRATFKEIKNINNNLKNTNSYELVKKRTKLPQDSILTEEWRAYAQGYGFINPEVEFERFKNYWTSKNARNPYKKDWFSTWQNWILKEVQRGLGKEEVPAEGSYNPYEG
ncbi:MAG: hypothetical protein ACK5N8_04655 [Alphaproteobacteria bacterium]